MSPLHSLTIGQGSHHVALVHGFTQTGNSMLPLGSSLEDRFIVHVIDAPNHGESSNFSLDCIAGANALCETVGKAFYVGYSMGARLCLHAALQRPQSVQGLVLISGTAGIDDPSLRKQRQDSDAQLANRIEQIGTEAFVEEWLSRPMFASLTSTPSDILDRNRNLASGLATSLRIAGTGAQEPLWDALSTLNMPVLLLAGENDEAFCAHALRMQKLIGDHATTAVLPDCGHSVHLEQPKESARIISGWLDQQTNR